MNYNKRRTTENYNKIVKDNVTKTYKLTDNEVIEEINFELRQITDNLSVSDRMETMASKEAFVTLKDQKEIYTLNLPTNLHYSPNNKHKNRTRTRNIIWFNPPFSKNVGTNVGRNFLNLIDKHFPASNPLHKIFNRNSVKVSYSCMNNCKSVICKHNFGTL